MSEITLTQSAMTWRTPPDNWRLISTLLDDELRAPSPDPAALSLLCGLALDQVNSRGDEARLRIQAAVARLPEDADLRVHLARAYMLVRDYAAAATDLDEALRLSPAHAAARKARFTLLQQTEQWTARDAMTEEIARIEPMNSIVAFTRLTGDASPAQAEAQLAACEAALAHDPAMTDAIYFKAIALQRLGRHDEAAAMRLDRFIEVIDLPDGDDEPEPDFRAGLARELLSNPSLTDKHDRPGRNILYAPDLGQGSAAYASRLRVRLMAAVDDFIRRHAGAADPFITHRPRAAMLSYWATVSSGTNKVLPHRHTSGWLSGVYYVAAPRARGEAAYAGALLLGELDPRFGVIEPAWGVRQIEPTPGRLVMFPSYVSHATAPTGAVKQRISVAFDVVPSP